MMSTQKPKEKYTKRKKKTKGSTQKPREVHKNLRRGTQKEKDLGKCTKNQNVVQKTKNSRLSQSAVVVVLIEPFAAAVVVVVTIGHREVVVIEPLATAK